MANALVIGASRGIGLATTECFLAAGHNVRAMSRTATTSMSLNHPRLEKFDADALDRSALQDALINCDLVVQSLGVPFNFQMITGPISVFSRATAFLVDAMQNNGPNRLICITGFGAGDCETYIHWLQRPAFKMIFGQAYVDKTRQEALIRNSDLDWTIVRPGMLTNGAATDDFKILDQPEHWVNGSISRKSVAKFICNESIQPRFIHGTPVLVQQAWF